MHWPKHRVLLLAIFCLGLTLHLVHYWAIANTAFPELPLVMNQSDMFANVEWARTILAGDWLGRSTYHPYFNWMRERGTAEAWYRWWGEQTIFQQSPLYPYWLAGWFAILGESLTGILLVQLVLGALDSLVIYCLARRLFDTRVGLVAALMTALYGPYIFQQGTLLRDWLPPILEPLALIAILRARESDRRHGWFLAGAAIGVALLAKESLLLFIPLLLLWLAMQYRGEWPKAIRASTALIFGIVIILTPLFIRNTMVGAPLLSISNRAAEGFIEGNAPDSNPLGFLAPPSLPGILERSQGSLTTVIYETLRLYDGDWMAYARLLLLKLRALIDPFEIPNNLDYGYAKEISPILRWMLGYGLILPLGLAGLFLSLRYGPRLGLFNLYAAITLIGQLSTIVLARYRLVLVPILIIYGAAALVRLFDAVRLRQWRSGLSYATAIGAIAVLQHVICPIPALRTDMATAHHYLEYFYSAKLYKTKGQFDRAVAETVHMRQRAVMVPDTKDNRGPKVITMSVALEREAYLRVIWANQLFERGHKEEGQLMADLAKSAYVESWHITSAFLGKPLDPQLEEVVNDTPTFFKRFIPRRETEGRGDAPALRTLIEWLEQPA